MYSNCASRVYNREWSIRLVQRYRLRNNRYNRARYLIETRSILYKLYIIS
jgi:hypothetical protein